MIVSGTSVPATEKYRRTPSPLRMPRGWTSAPAEASTCASSSDRVRRSLPNGLLVAQQLPVALLLLEGEGGGRRARVAGPGLRAENALQPRVQERVAIGRRPQDVTGVTGGEGRRHRLLGLGHERLELVGGAVARVVAPHERVELHLAPAGDDVGRRRVDEVHGVAPQNLGRQLVQLPAERLHLGGELPAAPAQALEVAADGDHAADEQRADDGHERGRRGGAAAQEPVRIGHRVLSFRGKWK
jgi:hypothetical protein